MDQPTIYQKGLAHYGVKSQEDKLIEEMAELMQAILKHRRKPTQETFLNLHEEFVDVQTVMFQLITCMDQALIKDYTEQKTTYLEELLAKGESDTNKY